MDSGIEREQQHPSADGAARLRTGMRWLVAGSIIALMALVSWSILSAASGSAAGMVAASSGSVAVVVAWTTGYVAISTRLKQLAAAATDPESA